MHRFHVKGPAIKRMRNMDLEEKQESLPNEQEPVCTAMPEKEKESEQGMLVTWRTDIGRIRKTNQDSVILGNGLFGVADGMGGHNGGEIASGDLRDGLLRELTGQEPSREALSAAISKINLEIWEKQEHDASLTGMGTTLTLLWSDCHEILLAQVGDSRAYLLRDGEMRQVTEDHSMVADMVRRGVLTEEQAACHPMRNYITRAVGTDDVLEVDLYSEERREGDRWLICSDGLYGQMSRDTLKELASISDPEEAADRLLECALANGGKDNISFILLTDRRGADEEKISFLKKEGNEAE